MFGYSTQNLRSDRAASTAPPRSFDAVVADTAAGYSERHVPSGSHAAEHWSVPCPACQVLGPTGRAAPTRTRDDGGNTDRGVGARHSTPGPLSAALLVAQHRPSPHPACSQSVDTVMRRLREPAVVPAQLPRRGVRSEADRLGARGSSTNANRRRIAASTSAMDRSAVFMVPMTKRFGGSAKASPE